MSKINIIPEVEADWAGMLKVVTRVMYAIVAASVAVIAYLVVTA